MTDVTIWPLCLIALIAFAKLSITHPATTTHQRIGAAARAELGITDGMVRLSCGLEHPDDVCEDLLAALDKV